MIPPLMRTNNPNNIVYLDIETTGLSLSQGARICEIAMLKVSDGIETTFNQLINPNQLMPELCSKIHGITDDMLKDSPKFADVAQEVANFIDGFVLICHNASFDLNFISKEIMENYIQPPEMYFIDTLTISRQYFSFSSNKLGNIAEILDIEVKEQHRAMADVLTMQSISKYLFNNLYRKGIDTLEPSYFEQSLTYPTI
ncbi:MAG: 3'-5' exonuclease [Endomicrobiia bacterium]|nr:3'-5' exonuclease [Endomicrobiaceae bacterium]MDD3053272.1 3'-5' exonuclease [Endomicrobiaceae bacterium]MDD3922375.1 3'-5' exonuclease [Endomicrobiaceae bacterium]